MKILKKRMLIIVILAVSTSLSCTKEKSENDLAPVVTEPEKEEQGAEFLPVKIGSGNTGQLFSYSNGNYLTKIEYGDGSAAVLTYDSNNQPLTFQSLKGNVLNHESEYVLNATGQVVRINHYSVSGASISPDGYCLLEYNTAGQLSRLSDYSKAKKLLNERVRTYTASGNLLSERSTATQETATYNFDEKEAIFKHVAYADLFALGTGDQLLTSAVNNITNRKIAENGSTDQSYTYVYNKSGYPQTLSYKKGTVTVSNAKVVYK